MNYLEQRSQLIDCVPLFNCFLDLLMCCSQDGQSGFLLFVIFNIFQSIMFRYLQGTTEMKLYYSRDEDSEIKVFSDTDWANDRNDRRSVTE